MKISKTDIEGVLVIEPRVFEDERGRSPRLGEKL